MGSPVDTVLAYGAVTPDGVDLPRLLQRHVGWEPAGLAGERMAVLAVLDASVMGGLLGLALPVADEAALRASLEQSPAIVFSDEKRFVVTLPPESELLIAQRVARAFMAGGSMLEKMAAMGQPVSASSTWELSFHEGHALIVPSFEAAFVVRKLLDELPADVGAEGLSAVLSLDVERIEDTFYEEFQDARRQLNALLSGDPSAGAAGILGNILRDGGTHGPALDGLPVDGHTLAALLEMLALDVVGAVQLQAHGLPTLSALGVGGDVDDDGAPLGEADDADDADNAGEGNGADEGNGAQAQLGFRLRWTESSALSDLLAVLRPAPAQQPGSRVGVLSADPEHFPAAFAHWLRPLVEVVHGSGAAAESQVAELIELLSPWDGLLLVSVADGTPLCVATLKSGERFDGPGLLAWFEPLLATFKTDRAEEGGDEAREGSDGADDQLPLSTWTRDNMIVLSSGEEEASQAEDLLDEARELRGQAGSAGGPALKLLFDGGQLTLEVVGETLEIVMGPATVPEERR